MKRFMKISSHEKKKKHQMDRKASRIGVLKFGIAYRGMQNRRRGNEGTTLHQLQSIFDKATHLHKLPMLLLNYKVQRCLLVLVLNVDIRLTLKRKEKYLE